MKTLIIFILLIFIGVINRATTTETIIYKKDRVPHHVKLEESKILHTPKKLELQLEILKINIKKYEYTLIQNNKEVKKELKKENELHSILLDSVCNQ